MCRNTVQEVYFLQWKDVSTEIKKKWIEFVRGTVRVVCDGTVTSWKQSLRLFIIIFVSAWATAKQDKLSRLIFFSETIYLSLFLLFHLHFLFLFHFAFFSFILFHANKVQQLTHSSSFICEEKIQDCRSCWADKIVARWKQVRQQSWRAETLFTVTLRRLTSLQ